MQYFGLVYSITGLKRLQAFFNSSLAEQLKDVNMRRKTITKEIDQKKGSADNLLPQLKIILEVSSKVCIVKYD